MDDRDVDAPVRPATTGDRAGGGLAEEVRATALLIALAVLATVGVALLVHLLLPAGS